MTFVRDGEVVGCCLLVWRTRWVRGIPLRRVYLNCAGEDEADETCTEYNSLLSLPDCGERVAEALASFLKKRRWDELMLCGVVDQEAIRILAEAFGKYEVSEKPARYVDFASLREQRRDYLNLLSKKKRYHIRRTQLSFEEVGGTCTVHLAQSVDEALEMLRQLAELHQATWKARGAAGSFSSARFTHFHNSMIKKHFDRIMLFRVQAGDEIVGLLYCFHYKGWVYYYQSGFCYSLNSRMSPGLLTLYYVISACLGREELQGFDFMAGDADYKRSLTRDSDYKPLRWFVVRRRTLPSLLYLLLRSLKGKYVGPTQKYRSPEQRPGGSEHAVDASVSTTGEVLPTTKLQTNSSSLGRFRVLVLDADSAAGLETVQSLGRGGCIIHTASLRPEYSRHRSRFIRRQIELAGSEDGGIRELVNLFRTENYDLVVPATEVALLAMLSPEIPDDMYERAVLPPRSSLQTALDKRAVLDLARRAGVRVPSGELVSVESRPPENFPVVLKPVFSKVSTSGAVQEFHVSIARDVDQWRAALGSTYRGVPVQQEQYISGKGLGVEMLFEHGALRWSFLHERVHEYPLTGGGSSYRISIELRGDLVQSATALLSALHWHGVAMVEFKVPAGGEAYLIEINPRLWGSLSLAIDCGVDFPSGLLCLSTGQSLPRQPEYRVGHFTRNIYRDVEWFKANLKADHSDPLLLTRPVVSSALEWLRPLVGKESWDFFCWSDLGVIIGELKTLVREHWTRLVRAIKRRSRNVYLRYLQQPRLIGRLRRRKIDRVLFLCHGNICRSPLAAALAARQFPNAAFLSAGFYPATGRSSPDFVLSAAGKLGVDLVAHRSQLVSAQLINEAGLVVIMDVRNRELLKIEFPHALEKTVFLGMLLPQPKLEIKDPYDYPDSMGAISSEINCAIEQLGGLLM